MNENTKTVSNDRLMESNCNIVIQLANMTYRTQKSKEFSPIEVQRRREEEEEEEMCRSEVHPVSIFHLNDMVNYS